MIELRLEHDWYCTPAWWNVRDGELVGEVDREDLPVSDNLWAQLMLWSGRMDATMNRQDPRDAGFKTEKELNQWIAEGFELWLRPRKELGPGYRVEYNFWDGSRQLPEDHPLPQ